LYCDDDFVTTITGDQYLEWSQIVSIELDNKVLKYFSDDGQIDINNDELSDVFGYVDTYDLSDMAVRYVQKDFFSDFEKIWQKIDYKRTYTNHDFTIFDYSLHSDDECKWFFGQYEFQKWFMEKYENDYKLLSSKIEIDNKIKKEYAHIFDSEELGLL